MYYKKVNYPENKPEKEGEYQTNNGVFTWHPEYGGAWYLKGFKESDTTVKWFYQPLTLISREKMIEKLIGEKIWGLYVTKEMAEPLAELISGILNAGIPEKTVHKSCSTHCDWPDCTLPGCMSEEL